MIKEQALKRLDLSRAVGLTSLCCLAVFLPFAIHIQWITGPVINAIFILTLLLFGIKKAVVIALVPSLVALSGGLLPPVLAPVVPFIMLANIIFIFTIDFFYNRIENPQLAYWSGAFLASGLKFLFLYSSVIWIQGLLIQEGLASQVAQMMSWPQFFTAIIGSFIAWSVLKALNKI